MPCKSAIIVQARMSSTRFPNKVLYEVAGKPLLGYLLDRLRTIEKCGDLIVATSKESSDDALEEYCQVEGLRCFRGSLDNVAQRFLDVMSTYHYGAAIRISGDSPLLDPAIVQRAWQFFEEKKVDIVTNVQKRTFPPGQSVEVFSYTALNRAVDEMRDQEDREHVTSYFYKHPEDFEIYNVESIQDFSSTRMVVDSPDDMVSFEKVVSVMKKDPASYGLNELMAFYL